MTRVVNGKRAGAESVRQWALADEMVQSQRASSGGTRISMEPVTLWKISEINWVFRNGLKEKDNRDMLVRWKGRKKPTLKMLTKKIAQRVLYWVPRHEWSRSLDQDCRITQLQGAPPPHRSPCCWCPLSNTCTPTLSTPKELFWVPPTMEATYLWNAAHVTVKVAVWIAFHFNDLLIN